MRNQENSTEVVYYTLQNNGDGLYEYRFLYYIHKK